MAKLTGAHLFIRCLKLEGIEKVFTIVGDTILPLVDAAEDEGIQFIDARHEGAALHMADGYARITGRPAAGIFTGGPGFSNAISALPAIYTSESPVIFIAGAAEMPQKGMSAFQEIDQIGMATPVTKGSWLIHDKTRIPEFVATAFRTATTGRPGPVHLTLPIDIQEAEITEDELPQYMPQEYRPTGRPQGDPGLIEQAASLLSSAKKPVIIAGNPARYSVDPAQLQELAESTGIPVFTVEQARGLLDDEHPLCFGYADGALNPTARRFREADVALLLGKRLDHRYRYGGVFSDSAKIIQADPSAAEIGRNRGVAVGIEADLGAVVEQITAACKAASGSKEDIAPWVEQLNKDAAAWDAELRAKADGQEPMHPLDVYTNLEQHLDEDTVLVMDGGDYVQWGRSFLKARKPGRFQRLGPLSHLGAAVPLRHGSQTGLSRQQSGRLLRRRGLRVLFHGIRHLYQAQHQHHHRVGERPHLGHRQDIPGGLLQPRRGDRPAADTVRQGGRGHRRLHRACGQTGGSRSGGWKGLSIGPSCAG